MMPTKTTGTLNISDSKIKSEAEAEVKKYAGAIAKRLVDYRTAVTDEAHKAIAVEVARLGSHNLGWSQGIAQCYGITPAQAQAIIDEVEK